jgi:hypothetical protein
LFRQIRSVNEVFFANFDELLDDSNFSATVACLRLYQLRHCP